MMHDIFARLMEARIDIKNKGTDENDLLIDNVSDALCIVSKPGWFGKDGVGYSIKSLAGSIKFTATFKKDGMLNLYLHTEPFFSADGKNRRIPIWLDYTSLIIDDAIIFSEKKPTWHDKAFTLEREVKDGQQMTFAIAWQPHLYEPDMRENMLSELYKFYISKLLPPPSGQLASLCNDVNPTGVTFSIFGICVSRDIVTLLGSRVNRFVQDVSPISVCYKSPLPYGFRLSEDNITEYLLDPKLNHFHVRNTILDMNKDVYSYLFEVKSDWLILDTGCLRYRTLVSKDDGVGVTECHLYRLKYKCDENVFDFVSAMDMDEADFRKCMDEYIGRILREYDEEKIIVVETYLVDEYVDVERRELHKFTDKIKDRNAEIRRGYEYLKQRLKKAHFIPFLDNTIGDEGHKWGKATLHYVPEYYEYGAQVVKIIVRQLSLIEEKVCIDSLKNYYDQRIQIEYLYTEMI